MVFSAVQNSESKNFEFILANMNKMLSEDSVGVAKAFTESLGISLEIVDVFTKMDPEFDHQFNLTVYARLFLMDKMDRDFFWFDADLILMPGWDQLFFESTFPEKEEMVICGVLDSKRTIEKLLNDSNAAFIKVHGKYVNAGVLKISTKNWRNLLKIEDWQKMAENQSRYGISLNDQDIINYLCADKIALIKPGFNYIVGDEIPFQEQIFIKHYAGYPKPWKLDVKGKEFFLAIQGSNYFRPKDWIAPSADAFLHYPLYWEIENNLSAYLLDLDKNLYEQVLASREKVITGLDLISRIKHFLIQTISQRFSR